MKPNQRPRPIDQRGSGVQLLEMSVQTNQHWQLARTPHKRYCAFPFILAELATHFALVLCLGRLWFVRNFGRMLKLCLTLSFVHSDIVHASSKTWLHGQGVMPKKSVSQRY